MLDYDDPDDYLDVSNHEVDRQDPLEYEVRTWRTALGGMDLQLHCLTPRLKVQKCSSKLTRIFSTSPLQEVALYKSSQQEKLGLTVCYRTDEDEDQGIYVGEVEDRELIPHYTPLSNPRDHSFHDIVSCLLHFR